MNWLFSKLANCCLFAIITTLCTTALPNIFSSSPSRCKYHHHHTDKVEPHMKWTVHVMHFEQNPSKRSLIINFTFDTVIEKWIVSDNFLYSQWRVKLFQRPAQSYFQCCYRATKNKFFSQKIFFYLCTLAQWLSLAVSWHVKLRAGAADLELCSLRCDGPSTWGYYKNLNFELDPKPSTRPEFLRLIPNNRICLPRIPRSVVIWPTSSSLILSTDQDPWVSLDKTKQNVSSSAL